MIRKLRNRDSRREDHCKVCIKQLKFVKFIEFMKIYKVNSQCYLPFWLCILFLVFVK